MLAYRSFVITSLSAVHVIHIPAHGDCACVARATYVVRMRPPGGGGGDRSAADMDVTAFELTL